MEILEKRLDNGDKVPLVHIRVLAPYRPSWGRCLPRPPILDSRTEESNPESCWLLFFVLFLWKVMAIDFRSKGFWRPSNGGSSTVPRARVRVGGREETRQLLL